MQSKTSQFILFVAKEVLLKTLFLCFIVTFAVYIMLVITPVKKDLSYDVHSQIASAKRSSIRNEDLQELHSQWVKNDDANNPAWKDILQGFIEIDAEELSKQLTPPPEVKRENVASGFPIFYFRWIKEVTTLNLGRTRMGQSVLEEVKQKLSVTFKLSFLSIFASISLSFIIGFLTIAYREKIWLNTGSILVYVISALPAFFLGYLLIAQFHLDLSSRPSYMLPVLTLTLSSGIISELTRLIVNNIDTEMTKNYVKTARAKGLKEKTVFPLPGTVLYHAFRQALIPFLPKLSLKIPFIISGALVVEKVFSLQGLSDMLLDGLGDHDISRVLIVILIAILLVRLGSIIADFCYFVLNPRYGQREVSM